MSESVSNFGLGAGALFQYIVYCYCNYEKMHIDSLENLTAGEAISRPAVWITSHGRHKSFLAILLCCRNLSWATDAFQAIPPVRPRPERRGKCGVKRLLSEVDPGSTDKKKLPRDVRFISPLLEYGYLPAVEEHENNTLSQKPLLLYLPGFDGTFLSPFLQFPELHTIFDVRCMTVGMQDRSTFEELKQGAIDFLLSEQDKDESYTANSAESEDSNEEEFSIGRGIRIVNLFASRGSAPSKPKRITRPVYLIGESFGGVLASEVALALLGREKYPALKGMALINAATCYDRSKLASEGPAVAHLHPLLYPAGLLKMLPLLTDEYSADQLLLILRAEALPSLIDDEIREAYMGRVAMSLPFVLKFMPQETLRWRLTEWLETGCTRMASRLSDFRQHRSFQTLIIAGERDGTLPSIDEAERLASVFPQAVVHVVEGAGHASTCGSRVDLSALFRSHFRELRPRAWQRSRTVMKKGAAAGKGKYFGMEPRYDGQTVGISPLTYWSRKYYRKAQRTSASANARTKATTADE